MLLLGLIRNEFIIVMARINLAQNIMKKIYLIQPKLQDFINFQNYFYSKILSYFTFCYEIFLPLLKLIVMRLMAEK